MPLPRNQAYIPTPANDAAHLIKWSEDVFINGHGLSGIGKRYWEAMRLMQAHEAVRFMAMMLISSGQQLPFFPDQL